MQEKMLIALIAIALACFILLLVILIKMLTKGAGSTKEDIDLLIDDLNEATIAIKDDNKANKELIINTTKAAIEGFGFYLKSFDDKLDKLSKALDEDIEKFSSTNKESLKEMKDELTLSLDKMRDSLAKATSDMRSELKNNLDDVKKDNEKQLEKMRNTVEEKLTATLEDRVKGAFETVSSRLESVQKGLGEMNSLAERVSNLNKAFTNVKTRGGWGEVSLQSLLEQILSPEQYMTQFNISGNERVDFAIVMPGGASKEEVYLPIDAKFPLEDYERLVDASEEGDVNKVKEEKKNLANRIKEQAKSIHDKYIKIPKTTPFAVMYLPTEGLYAEVIKDGSLVSDLQTKWQITVCGPTTITALLNSLQIGFTTLKIQKSSGEIVRQLNVFKRDFKNFTELIEKTKDKATKVVQSLDDMQKRNDLIGKRLSKVEDSEELEIVEDSQELIEE